MELAEKLTKHLVSNGIVTENDSDWLRYGIERRLTTIIIGCPFFILAILLTNLCTSVSFFLSFYFLRSRTNGFHSKSVIGCLIISLLCEAFFLSVVYYSMTPDISVGLNIVNILLVFLLAPYIESSFPLTREEIKAVTHSARVRVCILTVVASITSLLGMDEFANGITTGNAMAMFLLCLAYILNGGKHYEQPEDKNEESRTKAGISDD